MTNGDYIHGQNRCPTPPGLAFLITTHGSSPYKYKLM